MNNILEVKILPTGNGKSTETTESIFYQTMYNFPDQQLNRKKHEFVRKQISNQIPAPLTTDWYQTRQLCYLFFLTYLLEYNCFKMLCQLPLYNKVNQLYAYIYSHIPSLLHLPPTLPIPPLYVVTKHGAHLPVLCGCFPLAIYFTFGSVYMSMLLSHFVPV